MSQLNRSAIRQRQRDRGQITDQARTIGRRMALGLGRSLVDRAIGLHRQWSLMERRHMERQARATRLAQVLFHMGASDRRALISREVRNASRDCSATN